MSDEIDKTVQKYIQVLTDIYKFNKIKKIIEEIHEKNSFNKKKIKKCICKYVVVNDNQIKFDLKCNSKIDYKKLKIMFKKSKDKTEENNVDFMFNNICLDDEPKKKKIIIKKKKDNIVDIVDIVNDDHIDKKTEKLANILDGLMTIEYPEQKSDEWFRMRNERVTASDSACILGLNPYEHQYKFLIKKVLNPPFEGAKNTYHGCKYEMTATMIYEFRNNVKVAEFGLVAHPHYNFLAASPDGIVSKYKLDGISKTKMVGRMLEIKCTTTRKIVMTGDVKGDICPIYYWTQVQLQLECCNLEECDFWQCKILEYGSRDEFIADTGAEPYLSKTTGFEKGCIIQVLPKDKFKEIKDGNYWDVVYSYAKYLYPPKITMSPLECDMWIAETMANFNEIMKKNNLDPEDYFFDSVKYWKLIESSCALIERDTKWFNEVKPEIEKVWKYVLYFRENPEKSNLFFNWISKITEKYKVYSWKNKEAHEKTNEQIVKMAEFISNDPVKNGLTDKYIIDNYNSKLKELI